mmetsp:Transcript_16954/g.42005  ORF Transcript_16954/g.42005 Transcript_16954/m.42005 type:complete len:360 (+) Transcript_16954:4600-5679(+)
MAFDTQQADPAPRGGQAERRRIWRLLPRTLPRTARRATPGAQAVSGLRAQSGMRVCRADEGATGFAVLGVLLGALQKRGAREARLDPHAAGLRRIQLRREPRPGHRARLGSNSLLPRQEFGFQSRCRADDMRRRLRFFRVQPRRAVRRAAERAVPSQGHADHGRRLGRVHVRQRPGVDSPSSWPIAHRSGTIPSGDRETVRRGVSLRNTGHAAVRHADECDPGSRDVPEGGRWFCELRKHDLGARDSEFGSRCLLAPGLRRNNSEGEEDFALSSQRPRFGVQATHPRGCKSSDTRGAPVRPEPRGQRRRPRRLQVHQKERKWRSPLSQRQPGGLVKQEATAHRKQSGRSGNHLPVLRDA